MNAKFVIVLALAFFVGSYFGSMMAINLPAKMLKKIFGFVVLLLSLKMIFEK